jgi:Uma2 family endonuclease
VGIARHLHWTAEEFLSWVASQEERYEFDGSRPLAMTGGTARHSPITLNVHAALNARLRGTPCSSFGPDLGVRTMGDAVRYPDALVICKKFPELERIAPDVLVVFEVLSADSSRRDRIEKVREYAAVASIRRYVILESASIGLTVLHRQHGNDPWTAATLTRGDTLTMEEIGLAIPADEFYLDTDLAGVEADGG